ncbi:hypothetical protein HY450_00210 [Candidatus Pacearchaeota archaeon]|nr:hypothetical protein [Candidatus Pacearchaeota archaeon]
MEDKLEGNLKKKIVKPNWMKMKIEDAEKIIVELAGKGKTPAQIGSILRDEYGVPRTRLLGKRLVKILEEKGVKYKEDTEIINDKIRKIRQHIGRNKHDYRATRSLTKNLWDLHHLENN